MQENKTEDRSAVVEAAKKRLSRRGFLLGSAGLLGASAFMAAVPGVASAHEITDPDVDDELILNYALTLEHLEAAFYNRGFRKFRKQLGNRERKRFEVIREHENTHVDTLVSVIEDPAGLNGQAVPPLSYDFRFTGIKKFYATARLLENTGVKAYDGAIASLAGAAYLTAGATIATVEARHAAYLNELNGASPFPDAFDEAVAPADIISAVEDTGFVTGTPTPYGPYASFQAFKDRLPTETNSSATG